MTSMTSGLMPGISAGEHEVMHQAAARFMDGREIPAGTESLHAGLRQLMQPALAPAPRPSLQSCEKGQNGVHAYW
jgi:hypothetical protein